MKKIIAAAVATAFVVPVYAADVTVSGYMEWALADEDLSGSTTASDASNKSSFVDGSFTISATEEVGDGITVSADINISAAAGDDGGNSLTIAGDFGKVDLGDTSGAIDSIDDKGDLFKIIDNGISGVSNDAAINWTLPVPVEGLTAIVAYAPTNGDDNTINTNALGSSFASQQGTITDDVAGFSVRYTFGSVTVAYGSEEVGSVKNTDVNAQFSTGPIMITHEIASSKTDAGVETDYSSTAATYTMGDTKLIVGRKITDSATASSDRELTSYGIQHSIGALTLFAESSSEGKADPTHEGAYIGASFAF